MIISIFNIYCTVIGIWRKPGVTLIKNPNFTSCLLCQEWQGQHGPEHVNYGAYPLFPNQRRTLYEGTTQAPNGGWVLCHEVTLPKGMPNVLVDLVSPMLLFATILCCQSVCLSVCVWNHQWPVKKDLPVINDSVNKDVIKLKKYLRLGST